MLKLVGELNIVILVVFVLVCYVLYRNYYWRYKLRKLTGPSPLPVIGNVHQLGTDNEAFFRVLTKWAEDYRDAGCFVIYLGLTPMVFIYNAQDIEKLLCNTKLDRKSYQYYFLEWLKDGLLLSTGRKWISRRKLLTPSFHFSILSQFNGIVNEHAQILTDKLCDLADGSEFDLIPLITLCTLDTAFETIMGTNPRSQLGHAKEYVNAIHQLGVVLTERIQYPWYWYNKLFNLMPMGRKNAKYMDIANSTTQRVIRERKRDTGLNRDGDVIIDDKTQEVRKRRRLAFLDLLIETQRQNHDITDEGIQEEVDTFMFTGHDTTASTLSMAFYSLGRYPDIQSKVHEELDRVFDNDRDRPVTNEDLPKLEYLSRVMKESLRVLSTIPYVARDLEVDVNVCGTTLPKGTNVFMGLYWLHRDPEHFPDPLKFDPDRFLPEMINDRHKFAYLPFSAGHRNCIGQKFANLEVKIIMATVLRKLKVTSSQTIDELGLVNELTLRASKGVMVKLYPR